MYSSIVTAIIKKYLGLSCRPEIVDSAAIAIGATGSNITKEQLWGKKKKEEERKKSAVRSLLLPYRLYTVALEARFVRRLDSYHLLLLHSVFVFTFKPGARNKAYNSVRCASRRCTL